MPLTLKGTQQGIVMRPQRSAWDDVLQGLENALEDAKAFFRGGRVILEIGRPRSRAGRAARLQGGAGSARYGIVGGLERQRGYCPHGALLRIAHALAGRCVRESERPATPGGPEANAIFVQRTLRSGQSVKYAGHVILIGDVNPGAEVIAGGNVIVWGKIRRDGSRRCLRRRRCHRLRAGSESGTAADRRLHRQSAARLAAHVGAGSCPRGE